MQVAFNPAPKVDFFPDRRRGVTQPPKGTAETNADFTTWTAVSDLKNLRFNWRTYGDPQLRSLDLRQALAAAGGKMRLLPMGPQQPTAIMPLVPVEVSR
jgi:penicillin V acylase-like amidase (Ntn superfamily)